MSLSLKAIVRSIALCLAVIGALFVARASAGTTDCATGTSTAEYVTSGPFAGCWRYTVTLSWTDDDHEHDHAILTDDGWDHDDDDEGESVTLDFGLQNCPCVCAPGMWKFDNADCSHDSAPVLFTGDDNGDDDDGHECDPSWSGAFDCHTTLLTFTACEDEDHHDDDGPVTTGGDEYDDDDEDDCEDSNTATLVFYSLNGPITGTGTVHVGVECGEDDGLTTQTGDDDGWDDDDDCGDCTGHITGSIPGCMGCPSPVEPSTWGTIKQNFRK